MLTLLISQLLQTRNCNKIKTKKIKQNKKNFRNQFTQLLLNMKAHSQKKITMKANFNLIKPTSRFQKIQIKINTTL